MSRWTKRGIAVFVAVLFAVLLGMIVWAATHPHASRWAVLPDGTQVSLLSAEFPDPSVKVIGPFRLRLNRYDGGWRDWLYPKLPGSVLARFGIRPVSFSIVGVNSLVVWLKFQHLPPPTRPRTGYFLRVRDSSGVDATGESPIQFEGTNLAFCKLAFYPRRSGDFSVQIGCITNEIDAEGPLPFIPIHNPKPSTATSWIAEPLPARRSTNGLDITLVSLSTGMTNRYLDKFSWLSMNSGDLRGRRSSRADFELTEDGRPTTNWIVSYVTATDATGETFDCFPSDCGWVNSRYSIIFPGALWSDESAWDITATMKRVADFPPEDSWVLNGIRLPAGVTSVTNGATTNVGGVTAIFSSIEGRGPGQQVQNASGLWNDLVDGRQHGTIPVGQIPNAGSNLHDGSSYRAVIQLVNSPPDAGLVLVSATDDQGRSIVNHEMLQVSANAATATHDYACAFLVASSTVSVNLTFAVTHRRFATFRVKPAVATNGN